MLTALQQIKTYDKKILNKQLKSLEYYLENIGPLLIDIYSSRLKIISNDPYFKDTIFDEDPKTLKNNRDNISEHLKPLINSKDGHIKIENLSQGEMDKLLTEHFPDINNDTLVLTPTDLGGEIEGIKIDPSEKINRIKTFQNASKDTLCIIWNEEGFGHWVTFVADKYNNKVDLYYLNSRTEVGDPKFFDNVKSMLSTHIFQQ